MLEHRQQFGPVGCLYHSLYAVTGDEAMLDPGHVHDTSDARFLIRLSKWGLLAFPFWVTGANGATTDPAFWESLRGRFTRDNTVGATHAPVLVAIPGSTERWLHSVAVALPISPEQDAVQVSDSEFPAPLTFSWAGFLASAYATAHRVEMLGPLDLDAYP